MSTTIQIVTRPRKARVPPLISRPSYVTPSKPSPSCCRFSWNGRGGSQQVAPSSADRLQVLTETLSRSSTLKQLDEGFRNRYDRLRQQYTSLVYSSTLPESLQALIIGPGAMASESNREPSP